LAKWQSAHPDTGAICADARADQSIATAKTAAIITARLIERLQAAAE
jgi:hypothetical protein